MAEKIKKWYSMKLWTEAMVKMAASKCVITENECAGILGAE